jgi:hypothetical protein
MAGIRLEREKKTKHVTSLRVRALHAQAAPAGGISSSPFRVHHHRHTSREPFGGDDARSERL